MKTNFEKAIKQNTPEKKTIGQMIREERKKKGLTQLQLANKIGVSSQYIAQIENDRYAIGVETLRKVVEIGLGNLFMLDISKSKSFRRI